ncbi:Phage-related minor tail protein [Moraxella lacunata]|uniref:Phage-related minor tail protein n=1 Tax=Moraxella lacunata TaxID=477 RepID=A0A378T7T8_MORLA|nr:tape measure protein [Moraxella lacunata]STZ55596.1 Phage-related minor tail protein [Moraxella lacunata]
MEQTSRLSIVIDTGNAERDLQNLRRALADLEGSSGRAVGGVQRLDGSLQSVSRGFGVLKGVIGALGLGMTVGSIISTADSMQTLNNQLRLAADSAEKFGIAMENIERIAMENKVSLQSVGEMYVSNERALKQLGKGQQEVLRFTENVTKAMAVGGGSAQAQAAALTQLGQAMVSGVLRGDEFNSIAEQAPMIMTLMSDSLKVTTGELRKMASEGKLTANVVYEALTNAKATTKLQSMSGATATTVSQAMQQVSNQWELAVNKIMNGEGGISQSLASMISGFAGVIPKVLEFGEAFMQSENVKIIIDGIKESMVFVFETIQNGTQFVLDNAEAFTALASGIGASATAFLAIKAGMAIFALFASGTATVTMLSTAIGVLTGVTTAFGAVMAVITSPITLAVVAIGALVAAGVYLYRNWDEVKTKAIEVFNSLPTPVQEMARNIKAIYDGLVAFLKKAFDFFSACLDGSI